MQSKDLFKNIEGLVDDRATEASYSKDKEQLQALREALYRLIWEILQAKLTDKVAQKQADQIMAQVRKERKERIEAAANCRKPVEPPREQTIEPETHRTNRILA